MAQPVRTTTAELELTYHQFLIEDLNMEGFTDTALAASNGLVGVEPGRAVVLTGIHTGSVNLTVELFDKAPETVEFDDWDEVVDITLESFNGHLIVHGLMSNAPPNVPELSHRGPGTYRLRVHARGRDTAVDLAPEVPVEDYKLGIWPALPASVTVHKQSDGYGAGVRANRRT